MSLTRSPSSVCVISPLSFIRDISFWSPFNVKEQPRELKFTYLDTIGRPVVVVTAENLVEQHIQDFFVSYTFNSVMLLQEPLLVVAALYLFFLLVIVAVRLDFSITEVALVYTVCVALVILLHVVVLFIVCSIIDEVCAAFVMIHHVIVCGRMLHCWPSSKLGLSSTPFFKHMTVASAWWPSTRTPLLPTRQVKTAKHSKPPRRHWTTATSPTVMRSALWLRRSRDWILIPMPR